MPQMLVMSAVWSDCMPQKSLCVTHSGLGSSKKCVCECVCGKREFESCIKGRKRMIDIDNDSKGGAWQTANSFPISTGHAY